MSKKISKLFIFLMTTLLSVGNAYADTQAEQPVQTDVQSTVSVVNKSTGQKPTVNPVTGSFDTPLSAVFELSTNSEESKFILTSKVQRETETFSGFTDDGKSIIFVNATSDVTESAITDAKAKGSNNKNVIAYPFTLNIIPSSFAPSPTFATHATYGDGYIIDVAEIGTGTLTQTILGTPEAGTYNIGQDEAGTYQSTVIVTVVEN